MATNLTAQVNVKLDIDSGKYDILLDIPSTAPTAAAPYKFNISTPTPPPAEGGKAGSQDLLQFAMGGKDYVYVAVAPPESILSEVPVVEDLSVEVNEGGYDTETGKFATT